MFHSGFEAIETFLFVPNRVTTGGVHIKDANDMKRSMIIVLIAMIPALLFGMWNTGYQHFLAIGENAEFWQMVGFGFIKILPVFLFVLPGLMCFVLVKQGYLNEAEFPTVAVEGEGVA